MRDDMDFSPPPPERKPDAANCGRLLRLLDYLSPVELEVLSDYQTNGLSIADTAARFGRSIEETTELLRQVRQYLASR